LQRKIEVLNTYASILTH